MDTGPRGTLYVVALFDDPERVARYVQVQDTSTDRSYLPLRAAHHPDGSRGGGLEFRDGGRSICSATRNRNRINKREDHSRMNLALRLHSGQQKLTPAQEAEARRFAEAYTREQLSTEPVNEQQAGGFLRQAYEVAKLSLPVRMVWVDGPLQLVAAVADGGNVEVKMWGIVGERVRTSVWESVESNGVWKSMNDITGHFVFAFTSSNLGELVKNRVRRIAWDNARDSLTDGEKADGVAGVRDSVEGRMLDRVFSSAQASVEAYHAASAHAFFLFFDTYLAPNDLSALARFSQMVSGYWLGQEEAVIVRRPKVLSLDAQGRLHNETGKCIEYHDGWGIYAWHGVLVPEHVILTPDLLTRDDFLDEDDVEVRRVIQERMGERFVPELGGVVLDREPRGTLYEVALPDDPERVARYVQVQDASTERQYFLRVPPTVQTAAEAVAWSFGMAVEEYNPAQET